MSSFSYVTLHLKALSLTKPFKILAFHSSATPDMILDGIHLSRSCAYAGGCNKLSKTFYTLIWCFIYISKASEPGGFCRMTSVSQATSAYMGTNCETGGLLLKLVFRYRAPFTLSIDIDSTKINKLLGKIPTKTLCMTGWNSSVKQR